MNNYVILKWGSLKSYYFTEDFFNKNKKVVEELNKIFDEIYENSCSAIGGSENLQSKYDLKLKFIGILKQLYDLGVPFSNGYTDEYYNSFDEIKDYILNYGN